MTQSAPTSLICFHCGDLCSSHVYRHDDKDFCCTGCKGVYQLLQDNQLCTYYDDGDFAGSTPLSEEQLSKFAFLDDPDAARSLIKYQDHDRVVVEWVLPQMHCASCVWLLEHLQKLDEGIVSTRVNFMARSLTVDFDPRKTNLRNLATVLSRIGYEPHLESTSTTEHPSSTTHQRRQWLVLGVTGFCFGNIMLLSLPEYLGLELTNATRLGLFFRYLSLLISLPALWIGGRIFFSNAWQSLRQRQLHIDLGIALSIALTFGRSAFEIVTQSGSGYLDSMTGILFFMHIGRHFQNKTHDRIHFDLNYTHFFPLHVLRISQKGRRESIPIGQIAADDLLEIACQDIVPVDAICMDEEAQIDYSFVTGESKAVRVRRTEIIYAGGRNMNKTIAVRAIKTVDQSYLTQLWDKDSRSTATTERSFSDALGTYFTVLLLLISCTAFAYWYPTSPSRAWHALTTVLVVACPCALLLSTTFTQGIVLRFLAQSDIFIKNANVLERLLSIDYVVLDKTGTITGEHEQYHYIGEPLSLTERQMIAQLAQQSNHPLSRALRNLETDSHVQHSIAHFKQDVGQGLSALINGVAIKMGNAHYAGWTEESNGNGSRVFIRIADSVKGYFQFEQHFREALLPTIAALSSNKTIALLSGDHAHGHAGMQPIVEYMDRMHFEQSPHDKKEIIRELQHKHRVMMVGDGLNDAGALAQSDIGVAVSDKSNHFSPACDVLISGDAFRRLPELFRIARGSQQIIYMSFVISLLYNTVGLYYATQGLMSPLIAAILMPLSSISILLFTRAAVWVLFQISFKTDARHAPI